MTVFRTNLIKNPSFEDGTKFGWNGAVLGGTTAVTDRGLFGTKALTMTVPSAFNGPRVRGTTGAAAATETPAVTPGLTYTLSAWVRPSAARTVNMYGFGLNSSFVATNQYGAVSAAAPANTWTRLTSTFTIANAGDIYLYPNIEFAGIVQAGETLDIDGVVFEVARGTAGDFFDGSTLPPGATAVEWLGTPHISESRATLSEQQMLTRTWFGPWATSASTIEMPWLAGAVLPDPGDVVIVALLSNGAAARTHTMSGLGATWTKIGETTTPLSSLWMGVNPTNANTTITATQTSGAPEAGSYKYLAMWHLRGVTPEVVFAKEEGTATNMLVGPAMNAGLGQIVLGAGYGDASSGIFLNPAPATGWSNRNLEVTTGRWFSLPYRIPISTTPESHHFSTFRSGGLAHPIMQIVVGTAVPPPGRTNLVTNPSFETGTTGWTGVSRATTNPALAVAGTAYGSLGPDPGVSSKVAATAGLDYTGSAYLSRAGGARSAAVSLHFYDSTNTELAAPTVTLTPITTAGVPQRFSSTRTAPTGTTLVEIRITQGTSLPGIDGVLLEQSSSLGTYFDGSTVKAGYAYAWTGTAHASTSTEVTAAVPTVTLKSREAGDWVSRTAVPKVRVNGAWVTKRPKRWNGTAWVDLP